MNISRLEQSKTSQWFNLTYFKPAFRPLLILALGFVASFSGLAFAGTPILPDELKQDAKGRMVLLDFYSAYCGTCQMMEPHLKVLESKINRDVFLERVDLGKEAGAKYMNLYAIQGTPTYMLFDPQGKPIYRMDEMITPVVLERQVLRMTGQLKTVHLPHEIPLPQPTSQAKYALGQMILLSFESANCQDCKTMTPYLQGFELAGQQGLQVIHMNTDLPKGKKLMDAWAIKTLPTYMLLDNSKGANQDATGDSRPELFRMSGKMEPKMLWNVIRMFGDAGV